MYRCPERKPQDSRDGFFLYSAQASFSWPRVDLARLLRRACSRSFWIIPFEFVKVCGVRFFIWESFISFYIYCYPISTILSWHVYFPLEFEFRGKSCVEREHGSENGISCLLLCILLLYIEWIGTNYHETLRTATTNRRISFIDFYLVFPRNFRIVFLPHTNSVILMQPYCGTITEPGLPVV